MWLHNSSPVKDMNTLLKFSSWSSATRMCINTAHSLKYDLIGNRDGKNQTRDLHILTMTLYHLSYHASVNASNEENLASQTLGSTKKLNDMNIEYCNRSTNTKEIKGYVM